VPQATVEDMTEEERRKAKEHDGGRDEQSVSSITTSQPKEAPLSSRWEVAASVFLASGYLCSLFSTQQQVIRGWEDGGAASSNRDDESVRAAFHLEDGDGDGSLDVDLSGCRPRGNLMRWQGQGRSKATIRSGDDGAMSPLTQ
jgi:hypothetical protein